MKKIITLCAVMFITFTTVYGQDKEYEYHPWSEFQGDTVAFLDANFHKQTHFFDGKSILDVVNILKKEMPVKKITYSLNWSENTQLTVVELIFDDRMIFQELGQFHFTITKFDKLISADDAYQIFGIEQRVITPLTKELEKKLSKIILNRQHYGSNFSAYKIFNPFI